MSIISKKKDKVKGIVTKLEYIKENTGKQERRGGELSPPLPFKKTPEGFGGRSPRRIQSDLAT